MLTNTYTNGNTHVTILSDGTKVREWEGIPSVIHPESIDIKITDYCDAGCSFCHEMSTVNGKPSDLNELLCVISDLPAGVELAIGGGNPLSHPDLVPFLTELKDRGVIANMTVNQKHLQQYRDLIHFLISEELVKGLGISYTSKSYLGEIKPLIEMSENIVFHLIMGINKLSDIEDLHDLCMEVNRECKVLILGYKKFGFGINYYAKSTKIELELYKWYTRLALKFKRKKLVLSFDNLAINQLNLKRYFTKEAWSEFYMGDDGCFTMYIDAVKQEYALTSTSKERESFNNYTLLNYFKTHKNN